MSSWRGERYQVTLFWGNRPEPDVYYTDTLETWQSYMNNYDVPQTKSFEYRPGLYMAQGLVMAIREVPEWQQSSSTDGSGETQA